MNRNLKCNRFLFGCRNKRRGCSSTPSRFTADGNADRIRDFKNSAQGVAK